MARDPVFILGVPRSGTTLLRILLDSHPAIAAPAETPWIAGGYSRRSLRDLAAFLINHRFGPVANLPGVRPEHVYSAARTFVVDIVDTYLEQRDRRIAVLKTPDDADNLDFLLATFPDSR